MKKLVSAAVSAIFAASAALAPAASAEDEHYSPLFYFRAQESSNLTESGDVIVTREELDSAPEGFKITLDVYFQDDLLSCWYVAPKIKSPDRRIAMTKVYNPIVDYGDGLQPYAYAEVNAKGELDCIDNGFMATLNSEYNTINCTCQRPATIDGDPPLAPYGEKSDDYPLLSFEMTVDPATPAGVYDVYFLTEEEDFPHQSITNVATRTVGDVIGSWFVPRTENIRIIVADAPVTTTTTTTTTSTTTSTTSTTNTTTTTILPPAPVYTIGDLNGDGSVDSMDASDVLSAYANTSTGQPSGLSAVQMLAADVNHDGTADSKDASEILAYYAAVSTGSWVSPEEYFA